MILGFKQQFKEPILNYKKIHTIREDKHRRWKPGMKIHFATGVRTKNYNNFLIGTCDSVQETTIYFDKLEFRDSIWIDNKNIGSDIDKQKLAWNDGFKNYIGFRNWFIKMYGMNFKGRIIHFTNLRY